MTNNKDESPRLVSLTISTETFLRLAALMIGTYLLLLALRSAAHALLLIFTALFLAIALNGPVSWISKHLPKRQRGNRTLATAISFLVVLVFLGGFFASIVPPLVRQTQNFINAAPKLVQDFRSNNGETGKLIRRYHLQGQVDNFSRQLSDRLRNLGGSVFSTAQRIGSSVFSILTILVLAFMILVEGPRWLDFGKRLLPGRHQARAERLALEMYRVIKGFVNGQVTLAAIAAFSLLPGLLLLHIPYPVALMVIVFISGLIPMVGHTIGAIIVSLVGLFESTTAALLILAYYILYQQIENYLVQPRIQANSTNMSPLLVFMSVVIGVSFGGLFGGLFAIPIAGCLRVALLEYLQSKRLIAPAEVRRELAPPSES